METAIARNVEIFLNRILLDGDLFVPTCPIGLVLFVHGSGSSRRSSRNVFVAEELHRQHIGTLLFDLLTEREDQEPTARFDIELLTHRILGVTDWVKHEADVGSMPVAYFGASTGAAAALKAAAVEGDKISAVVSRGGRPDLAGADLPLVKSPTLLIVGGEDAGVIELNRAAYEQLQAPKKLVIVSGATHLFEEEGKLAEVATLAALWFTKYFRQCKPSASLAVPNCHG